MADKKVTRIDALNAAIAVLENVENGEQYIEPLRKMVESLEKRSASPTGPSKARRENEALLAQVLDAMDEGEGYPAGHFVGRVPYITTPQKATAVLRLGVANGVLKCEKEGKTNKYYLV